MSTFTTALRSVTFIAAVDGWKEEWSSEVSEIAYPGGDDFAISISGQKGGRRTVTAVLDSIEDFRTLRDMRADEGMLLVSGWDASAVRAVLIQVSPEPPWNTGEVSCTAQFLLY